jgi:hypothetical protein
MDPTTGLFDTVIDGPASACYGVGWALWAVGVVFSLVNAQFNLLRGRGSSFAEVLGRSALGAVALGLFTFISKAVWWAAQGLAVSIYPDTKMQAFGKVLAGVAMQFQNYSFSLTGAIAGLRDSFVLLAGVASWLVALLGHWEMQQVQRGVYNVVFAFGPLLIGLSAFGLPTGTVWFTALMEVSSWSITMAVIYRGIADQMSAYFADAQSQSFLSLHFLDVVENCVFLASMTVVVPVVTGRLLGLSALGELSKAVMGPTAVHWLSTHISRVLPNGPHMEASGGAPPPPPPTSSRRPGD